MSNNLSETTIFHLVSQFYSILQAKYGLSITVVSEDGKAIHIEDIALVSPQIIS